MMNSQGFQISLRIFGDIDKYLDDLEQNVKNHNIWLETAHKCENPWDYLTTKNLWIQKLDENWSIYKMHNPTNQKIPEYEVKLKTCQVYLDIMSDTLIENTMNVIPDFKDHDLHQALTQSIRDMETSSKTT